MAALELYFSKAPQFQNASLEDKIIATLQYLTGQASIWATPLSEKLNSGQALGIADWDDFKEIFKRRFETANAEQDAKEALKNLWMG